MTKFGFALAATLLLAPALAHAGPFDGTWNLDTERSHLEGGTFSFTQTATGYRYSNGSTLNYTFAIDGKDYTTVSGFSVAWSKAADGGFDTVSKGNGKVTSKGHVVVSSDDTTLTVDYINYRPDGSTATEHDVSKRLSGGPGLAGRWKDVKIQAVNSVMTISARAGGRFEIDYPKDGTVITGRLDGSPSPVTGPNLPPDVTVAYTATGRRKWTYATTVKGKVYFKGTLTVSADGKTLTDKSWAPGKAAEASVAIYTK